MWPDTVISILPSPKFGVQFGDIPWHLIDFIEFLGMSPMGSLNTPFELWTLRRQNKEPNLPPLTLLFKLRIKLRSPIHLQSLHLKWHPLLQRFNKFLGRRRNRTGPRLNHIPPRNHIPRRKLLERHPGKRPNTQGIHLHQIPRPSQQIGEV
jgi:hypothetical protein